MSETQDRVCHLQTSGVCLLVFFARAEVILLCILSIPGPIEVTDEVGQPRVVS